MSSSSATDIQLRRTLPRPVVELWIGALDAATDEARLKSALATFEWAIRLQIAWALPVYLASPRDEYIDKLLTPEKLTKMALGRWVELHRHLARALAARDGHFLAGAFDWYVDAQGHFKAETLEEIDSLVELRNREDGHRKKGVFTANDARDLAATAVPAVRSFLRRAVILHGFRMVVLRRVKRRTRSEFQGEARFLLHDAEWVMLTLTGSPVDTDPDDEPVVHLINASGEALLALFPLVALRPDAKRADAGSLPHLLDAIAKEAIGVVQPTTGSNLVVRCHVDSNPVAWSQWLAQPPNHFAELVVANPNAHPLLVRVGGALPVDGQVLCGHYELREIIGEGGMATVWRVWDSHLREECALKVLRRDYATSPEILERFQREAVILRRLRHPNVLSDVHFEKDRDDGTLVIRMKLYAGRTLRQCIAANPAEAQVLRWADQSLSALVALHAAGIVHRDVKPANFLIDDAGDLVLGDFGVALDESARMTRTVHQHGTLAYMAPEAVVSARSATGKADVYSLGKVLHELLVGEELDHTVRPGEDLDGPFGELLKAMGQRLPAKRLSAAEALDQVRGLSGVQTAVRREDAARAGALQAEADSRQKAELAAAQAAERKRQKEERQAEAERKKQEAIAERKFADAAEAKQAEAERAEAEAASKAEAARAKQLQAEADSRQKAEHAAAQTAERKRQKAERQAEAERKKQEVIAERKRFEAFEATRLKGLADAALAEAQRAAADWARKEKEKADAAAVARRERLATEEAAAAATARKEKEEAKLQAKRKLEAERKAEADRLARERALALEKKAEAERQRRLAAEGEAKRQLEVVAAKQVVHRFAENLKAAESEREREHEAEASARAAGQPMENRTCNELRLGLVYEDRLIGERTFPDSTQVTVGNAGDATIVLPEEVYQGPSLVFQGQNDGTFSMRAPAGMKVRLAIDGTPMELNELQAKAKARQVGTDVVVDLSLGNRGRAAMGWFTLLLIVQKRADAVAKVEPEPLAENKLATDEYKAVEEASNRLVALAQAVRSPIYSPSTSARGAIARPQHLTVSLTAVNGKFGIVFKDLLGHCCVKEVVPGGAAALAGICPGDVLVALDGVPLPSYEPGKVVEQLKGRPTRVLLLWRGLYRSVADDEVRKRYHSTAYHVDGDGTIWDPTLQLTWQQAHSDQDLQWAEATNYATNLRTGGHCDWRLPTIFEILSLVDLSRPLGDRVRNVFQNTAGWFWSSSPYRGSRDLVLQVDFWSGDFCYTDRSSSVRCVR